MSRHDSKPELAGSILPANAEPEARWDVLSGQWVIVAPGRGARPHPTELTRARRTRKERVADCPLCPGNEDRTPPSVLAIAEPGSTRPWDVRVIPNLYPAVSGRKAVSSNAGPLFRSRKASGFHEVVVETSLHNRELPDRELDSVLFLIDALQERLKALEERPGTRHVAVFKNKGVTAGTSLEHPHSQIVALDFLPVEVRRNVQIARRFHRERGDCLLCAMIEEERHKAVRLVFEREGFVALAPYASRSAGETLLVPLAHAPSFTTASEAIRACFGRSLQVLLARVREAFDDPDYNLMLQTAPKQWQQDAALHWYWRLCPRLTRTAGLELGTGLQVNPMAPEEAASLLRSCDSC